MRGSDRLVLILAVTLTVSSIIISRSTAGTWLPHLQLPELSLPQVKLPELTFWQGKGEHPLPSEHPSAQPQIPSKQSSAAPQISPTRLIVPKLGINAVVEGVGRTQTGNMDVPKNAADVGWFEEGPTPSVRGNAVITGHYDTPSGRPAVFYRLNRLSKGDAVIVELGDGTRHEFIVTGKDVIPYEIFPSEYVFATKYGINLNLITCNGIWNREDKIYNKRLVIYTTLKGSQFSTF